MSDVEQKLAEMGLKLPASAPPLFNYVPYVTAGNMVFVAGQVPIGGGALQLHRRPTGTDHLAAGPLSAVRRGHHLLAVR